MSAFSLPFFPSLTEDSVQMNSKCAVELSDDVHKLLQNWTGIFGKRPQKAHCNLIWIIHRIKAISYDYFPPEMTAYYHRQSAHNVYTVYLVKHSKLILIQFEWPELLLLQFQLLSFFTFSAEQKKHHFAFIFARILSVYSHGWNRSTTHKYIEEEKSNFSIWSRRPSKHSRISHIHLDR